MFKFLAPQTLDTLSDEETQYQFRDRLSFMRLAGLADTAGAAREDHPLFGW